MRPLILSIYLLLAILASVRSTSLLTYDVVTSELIKNGANPHKSILVKFPSNTTHLIHSRTKQLYGCYAILPGQGDIFKDPLAVTIYMFLKNKYKKAESGVSEAKWREKIRYLDGSIRELAGYIIDCVVNNRKTSYGLNERSDHPLNFAPLPIRKIHPKIHNPKRQNIIMPHIY